MGTEAIINGIAFSLGDNEGEGNFIVGLEVPGGRDVETVHLDGRPLLVREGKVLFHVLSAERFESVVLGYKIC